MRFPVIVIAFLTLLALFASAVSSSIVRRKNGGRLTSITATKTAHTITKTATASCSSANSSPSSDTSYYIVISNGNPSGLVPYSSAIDNTRVMASLLNLKPSPYVLYGKSDDPPLVGPVLNGELEPRLLEAIERVNFAAKIEPELVRTKTDIVAVQNDDGTITLRRVTIVISAPLAGAPTATSAASAAAATAASGIFASIGDFFDSITPEDIALALPLNSPLGLLVIPIVIVDDLFLDEILDTTLTSGAAGPESTDSSNAGKGKASGVWSVKLLRGDAVVVVCPDAGKTQGGKVAAGKKHH
jgi:hypothetical protein